MTLAEWKSIQWTLRIHGMSITANPNLIGSPVMYTRFFHPGFHAEYILNPCRMLFHSDKVLFKGFLFSFRNRGWIFVLKIRNLSLSEKTLPKSQQQNETFFHLFCIDFWVKFSIIGHSALDLWVVEKKIWRIQDYSPKFLHCP